MGITTRVYLVLVGVVGLVTGGALLVAPAATRDYFAWSITPPQTAVFMGSGYLGTGLTLLAGLGLARTWSEIRLIVPPIGVFATTMIAATLLHADRFLWDRPITWLWIGLYGFIIVGGLGVTALEARRPRPAVDRVPVTQGERVGLVAVGILTGVWAILLFGIPDVAENLWPWDLSPLTSRVVAGWIGVAAALAATAAIAGEARGIRVPLLGWTATVSLFLISSLGNLPLFQLGDPRTIVYFAGLGGSVGGAVWLLARIHSRVEDDISRPRA